MLRVVTQRPIAVSMAFLALVLIGALSFRRLPVDLLPSVTYPRLTVITTYEDVPAQDLERLVTQPIEEVVTALSGVRRVVSKTREGVSIITVEYQWGTQMDFANLHLREAVDRVAFREDFPEDAERPVILRWDPLSRPISILTLRNTRNGDMEPITEFAREVVKPAIQQVDGVSQAEVVGGSEREILVEPDPRKMEIYGITVDDVQTALARSNVSFPGGKVRRGPLHLSLRIAGEYESLDDIRATDIIRSGGSPVRIADVARVTDTTKDPEGATLLGDEPVVSLLLYKEPEANTIQVSREVDRALDALAGDYGDLQYEFVYRDAEFVRESFAGLIQSLVAGAFLAFVVLFVFLHDFRSPVVVGVAIPVSIFITFALLYFGKVKLNLMSLGGLSLAAGMLVDNAIVVIENINRHLHERFSKERDAGEETAGRGADLARRRLVAECAVHGTNEVARAVFASTLTTVAVFFPVVYVPGIAGAFFRDQALTVTFSMIVSIASALILQPMLSARLLSGRPRTRRGLFAVFDRAIRRFGGWYHRILARALRRPGVMLAVLFVGLAAATFVALRLDRELMPKRTSGDFRVDMELPSGTPLEETIATVKRVAGYLEDQPDVRRVFSQVGRTERTLASVKEFSGPNTARIRVMVTPGRGGREKGLRLRDRAEQQLRGMPGPRYVFHSEGIGLRELLASDEAPFSLGIVADDPRLGLEYAEEIARRLSKENAVENPRVDRVLGTPNVVVHLDAEEIIRSGLDPERVAREFRNRISGVEATTFNEVDQRIDISVRIPREERRDLAATLNASIRLSSGETAPLGAFVHIREERPVRELTRRNQKRMVTISAELLKGSLDDAWRHVSAVVADLDLPPGVRVVPGGERTEMLRSFHDLGWAMILAVLLVYMILAAQFESFTDPLIIASVIPIGFAGAVFAVAASGGSLNMLSMIGMVALLGIAVNDAIIKIDTIRRLRDGGMAANAAILEASRLRLRPIVMTSATTMLAMIPMAIGMGSGEQLQRPLALTIIGGLFLTTSLTLLYTPLLYRLAHRLGRLEE